MYYIRQHSSAILSSYKNELPLSHFLKKYFKQFPILGSRDRKLISAMVYSFYRCSKGIAKQDATTDELINCSLLLCENQGVPVQRILPDEFSSLLGLPADPLKEGLDKLEFTYQGDRNFPFALAFSSGITREQWVESMLHQPLVFIHVIEKYRKKVLKQLSDAGVAFDEPTKSILSLPPGTAIDKVLKPDSYRVQDLSSQQTGTHFETAANESWWDACCGAGGKSLLLKERESSINLTVSDLRSSMLDNLSERFYLYGFKHPEQFMLSAAQQTETTDAFGINTLFDSIICDVPCSGSGTWARTPEEFYFFNPETITTFSSQQFAIASNVINHLKPGGKLYYITCSVFQDENESIVKQLVKTNRLTLDKMDLINGIEKRADSMFIAVLTKS